MSRDINSLADYREYQFNFAQFFIQNRVELISSKPTENWPCPACSHFNPADVERCEDCDENRPAQNEPYFSWSRCECCDGSLGGNREDYIAVRLDGSQYAISVCEDCVYYNEYGRLDDTTMQRIPAEGPVPVWLLQAGDYVDLEGDKYADPDPDSSNHIMFECEYAVVETVERETDECAVVHFENGPSIGFPPNHVLNVAARDARGHAP